MSFGPIYYTGYEEEDDEFSDIDESQSSADEVEKDVIKFFKSKKVEYNASLNKSELADDFEAEMNQKLNEMVEVQKKKYFHERTDEKLSNELKEPIIKKDSAIPKSSNVEMNYEIEDTDSEEELLTGVRCKKSKPQYTNDELLYDPDMDDEDQNWVNKQRKTSKKVVSPKKPVTSFVSGSGKAPEETYLAENSDAVLNCPCCMAVLSMDCQRHEKFKTQYRAMFVFNCQIDQEKQLKYPKHEMSKKKSNKYKKQKKEVSIQSELIDDEAEFDLFRSVTCESCNTRVGVYDEKEEIYHFFNVLASHS